MLTLNIEIGDFVFRDIKKNELDLVLELYNDDDESMFATGTSRCLSLEDMEEKYLEVLISSHEFFIGIFLKTSDKLIGVLKGRIDYEHNEEAWITSFIIKKEHRNMGIGNKTINAFMLYMQKLMMLKGFMQALYLRTKMVLISG